MSQETGNLARSDNESIFLIKYANIYQIYILFVVMKESFVAYRTDNKEESKSNLSHGSEGGEKIKGCEAVSRK